MMDKQEVMKNLANRHYVIEPGITRIFQIFDETKDESAVDTPIKLLEINDATVPSGVMPLYFAPVPASGIPYPTVIVEVTPDEYDRIESKELSLPRGWIIGPEVPRGEG